MPSLRRRHPFRQRQALRPSADRVVGGSRHAALADLRHGRPVPFQVVGQCGDQVVAVAARFVGYGQQEVLLAQPVVTQGLRLPCGRPFDRRRGHQGNVPLAVNGTEGVVATADPAQPGGSRRGACPAQTSHTMPAVGGAHAAGDLG